MLCKAFSPLSLPNLQSRVSKARSAPLSIWGCWREQMLRSNFSFKTSISNLRLWASQLLWHRKPSYVVRTKASFLSNGICLKLFCKSRQWGGRLLDGCSTVSPTVCQGDKWKSKRGISRNMRGWGTKLKMEHFVKGELISPPCPTLLLPSS